MNVKQIFGKQQILPGGAYTLELENTNLTIIREKEGWTFVSTNDGKNDYHHTGKSNTLIIQPALPEKPLVFKGSRLNVSPKQKLTFFLKVPLTVQVYFSKAQPENLMKEIAVKRLSDTWFGESDNGEVAFALANEYFLNMEEANPSEFEAICPVTIFNNSPTPFEIERLIIRVENMGLYQNAEKIVTSVAEIEYKGKDVISSAEYHYSKIYNGEKQELITKPRNQSGKNPLKIHFHIIKNMYKFE
jgi:hypothetical protein